MMENSKQRKYRFGKSDRLRHRTLVEGLFSEGHNLYEYPLRLVWRKISAAQLDEAFLNGRPPGIGKLQMMVTVPKKKRRHAVDRVLMRRRIREAYRLNRLHLLKPLDERPGDDFLQLAFIYLHNDNMDYADIERKMKSLIFKLGKHI